MQREAKVTDYGGYAIPNPTFIVVAVTSARACKNHSCPLRYLLPSQHFPEIGVQANVRIKNSSENDGFRAGVSLKPRGICQRGGNGHRAEVILQIEWGTQTPAAASSAPARRDLTIPCGSSTNFFAAPLSKSRYPRGASSNRNTSTLTAFAISTLSCRMAIISCRL